MKRLLLTALAAAGLLATAAAARAQPGFGTPGFAPPPTSFNWLNLRRPGNAGINYYGLVRPQQQTYQALQQLQTQVNQNAGGAPNLAGLPLPGTTGVVGGFQTQWPYFQNVPLTMANMQTAMYTRTAGYGGGYGGPGGFGGYGGYGFPGGFGAPFAPGAGVGIGLFGTGAGVTPGVVVTPGVRNR